VQASVAVVPLREMYASELGTERNNHVECRLPATGRFDLHRLTPFFHRFALIAFSINLRYKMIANKSDAFPPLQPLSEWQGFTHFSRPLETTINTSLNYAAVVHPSNTIHSLFS